MGGWREGLEAFRGVRDPFHQDEVSSYLRYCAAFNFPKTQQKRVKSTPLSVMKTLRSSKKPNFCLFSLGICGWRVVAKVVE